jgi:hypothetical protein
MFVSISVVCYKSKTLSNGQHPLMIQVSFKGKRKYQSLGISVHPDHWDFLKCKPKPSCTNGEYIQKILSEKILDIQKQILEYNALGKECTPRGLFASSKSVVKENTVAEFYRELILTFEEQEKTGNR